MKKIYRHDNHLCEFVELWKDSTGYTIEEYVFNGTDYLGFYEVKKQTYPEAIQFILDMWFHYR